MAPDVTSGTADMSSLETLLAKSEIAERIHTYPRGLDRLDPEILLSIAHPDATVEFSTMFKGTWKEYVAWLMKAHHSMVFNNHRISNTLIEVNGVRAASETTSTATLLVKRDDGNFEDRLVYSRYLDRWRKDGGPWLLEHRTTLRDLRRVTVITAEQLKTYEFNKAAEVGLNDLSYSHFAAVKR